jgi:hypothetical protein
MDKINRSEYNPENVTFETSTWQVSIYKTTEGNIHMDAQYKPYGASSVDFPPDEIETLIAILTQAKAEHERIKRLP